MNSHSTHAVEQRAGTETRLFLQIELDISITFGSAYEPFLHPKRCFSVYDSDGLTAIQAWLGSKAGNFHLPLNLTNARCSGEFTLGIRSAASWS